MSYAEFLDRKATPDTPSGIEPGPCHDSMFPFQEAIVKWACRRGRAAVFADCGLGKTRIQIEWARLVAGGKPILIFAPLSVAQQTIDEGREIGVEIEYVTAPTDAPFQVTNYERAASFVGHPYEAVVLDESSILKSLDGKTRTMLIREFTSIPFRLCCTATPAPNDLTELGNHAEFLGIASFREMSATYFVKESNGTKWRLKGHASEGFYRWLASWSVYIRLPSDVGFSDDGFVLPDLNIINHEIESTATIGGFLFPTLEPGIRGRTTARKSTITERVDRVAELCADGDSWIVWCGLNDEGRELKKRIPDAELVEGAMSADEKAAAAKRWIGGESRVMITKPSIFGFGMNFQHCHKMAFLGLGDSYEQYYQSIRRCHRFGQKHHVEAHIVTTNVEREVAENVRRKEREAIETASCVVDAMRDFETENVTGAKRSRHVDQTDTVTGDGWTAMMGDSCERLKEVEDDSVGLSVYSPPFVSLYTYTATERDIGNSKDEDVFFEHYGFIIDELFRATMPGRQSAVHVSQIPAMVVRDGYIGMKDFRARVVVEHEKRGWIYHGELVIDKDPQAQAIRTKSKCLMFTQLRKDSAWMRPALADYILLFRKPGENKHPVHPDDVSNEDWISWARPVWYGIQESDTLNFREARADKDERHICPLQLGVIERCIRLWSNPGDLVCSPFMGIGSEGYQAIAFGRRFVGCELKPEYFRWAVKNLEAAKSKTASLFD